MSGWFAVKRGITSHHIFKGNPQRLAVWVWLLDNAVWKDTKHDVNGKTVPVSRGSVCASTRRIAGDVGVGHQVVRSALDRFKDEHMINTDTTHGKSLITLCNYEKYQDPKTPINTAPNTAATQQQHSSNTQKEQVNNITRESKDSLGDFEAFWDAVPRKVGKGAARKAYAKAVKEADPYDLLEAMMQYAKSRAGENPKFTVHPATWLTQGRWEDEPDHSKHERRLTGAEIAEQVAASFAQVDRWQDTDTVVPLLPAGHTRGR